MDIAQLKKKDDPFFLVSGATIVVACSGFWPFSRFLVGGHGMVESSWVVLLRPDVLHLAPKHSPERTSRSPPAMRPRLRSPIPLAPPPAAFPCFAPPPSPPAFWDPLPLFWPPP